MSNDLSNISKSIDYRISFSVLSCFIILLIQIIIRALLNSFEGSLSNIIKLAAIFVQGFIYFFSLKYVLKRKLKLIIFSYLFSMLIILINLLVFESNREYLIRMSISYLMMSLPSFIFIASVEDYNMFFKAMNRVSNISVILALIIFLLTITGVYNRQHYSMGLSYYLLFPLIVETYNLTKSFKVQNVAIVFLITFLILFLGSRGAVACFLGFIILMLLQFRVNSLKKLFELALLILIILTICFNISKILYFLAQISYKYLGFKSRSITLFLNNFNYSSGRDIIYNKVLEALKLTPMIGLGIGGDRVLMGDYGLYSHNIFIEILSNFGIIVGTIICTLILFLIVKTLIIKGKYRDYAIIWVSLGFLPLLISGSYFTDITFWIMISLFINFNKLSKEREINE